jgi:hypothetical protein
MKGILFIFFILFIAQTGFSQCVNTFEVSKVQKANSGRKDGSITVKVNASGRFECELLAYKNKDKVAVAKKEDFGRTEVVFANLGNDFFYRIVLTFSNETDPLCKQRVVERVVLTDDKL